MDRLPEPSRTATERYAGGTGPPHSPSSGPVGSGLPAAATGSPHAPPRFRRLCRRRALAPLPARSLARLTLARLARARRASPAASARGRPAERALARCGNTPGPLRPCSEPPSRPEPPLSPSCKLPGRPASLRLVDESQPARRGGQARLPRVAPAEPAGNQNPHICPPHADKKAS